MNQDVSSLKLPQYVAHGLKKIGINYCKDVDICDAKTRRRVSQDDWEKTLYTPKFKTALDLYEEECLLGNIVTFNKELDVALDGGLRIGQITELCGEPGSGKTQTCFQLCVNVQLPIWCGGADGEALYICTNSNFAPQRLKEIAQYAVQKYNHIKNLQSGSNKNITENLNVDKIMAQIHYVNITDYLEICAIITYLQYWLENHKKVRLIVIDSISTLLKQIEGKDKIQIIYKFLSDLQMLSNKYKFAIVVTNDITTRINANNAAYKTPSLGGSYFHRINTRIQLTKLSCDTFKAEVVKSIGSPSIVVQYKFNC